MTTALTAAEAAAAAKREALRTPTAVVYSRDGVCAGGDGPVLYFAAAFPPRP
jgi:hypothetical protein